MSLSITNHHKKLLFMIDNFKYSKVLCGLRGRLYFGVFLNRYKYKLLHDLFLRSTMETLVDKHVLNIILLGILYVL